MTENTERCGREVRWRFLAVGILVAFIGGMFTASVIGAFIRVPLLLLGWPARHGPGVRMRSPHLTIAHAQ
jgi:hypothetical protein